MCFQHLIFKFVNKYWYLRSLRTKTACSTNKISYETEKQKSQVEFFFFCYLGEFLIQTDRGKLTNTGIVSKMGQLIAHSIHILPSISIIQKFHRVQFCNMQATVSVFIKIQVSQSINDFTWQTKFSEFQKFRFLTIFTLTLA